MAQFTEYGGDASCISLDCRDALVVLEDMDNPEVSAQLKANESQWLMQEPFG